MTAKLTADEACRITARSGFERQWCRLIYGGHIDEIVPWVLAISFFLILLYLTVKRKLNLKAILINMGLVTALYVLWNVLRTGEILPVNIPENHCGTYQTCHGVSKDGMCFGYTTSEYSECTE